MDAVIKVTHFKKSFGEKTVHKDVTFEVQKGDCLCLVGGSGCGKSVVLRSLIGLEKADGGKIEINGEDIVHLSERELVPFRKKVAYVFQGGALFDSLSVFDNLAFPLREHTSDSESLIQEKVLKKLSDFGLKGTENLYPNQLSGGMQKRVGLARAIMLDPSVVLYDEPTAGLDPSNTKKIQEHILALKATGVTSILVTHDMPTAFAVADRMAFLMGGVVAVEGDIEHIKNDHSIMGRFISGDL